MEDRLDWKTYEALGLHLSMNEETSPRIVNGRSNREIQQALATPGDRQYHPNPEAFPAEETPRGAVRSHRDWDRASVFPGTKRDLWIYTPAGFDPAGPAPALMVFQDGGGYLNREGPIRAAAVFDTLLAADEMPPTIGVFVMPGRLEGVADTVQRSREYDSVTDAYARFLTRRPAAVRRGRDRLQADRRSGLADHLRHLLAAASAPSPRPGIGPRRSAG